MIGSNNKLDINLSKLTQIAAVVILLFLIIISLVVSLNPNLKLSLQGRAQTVSPPSVASSCASLSIRPNRSVYNPGEQVTITAQGVGDVVAIRLWYKEALDMLTVPGPGNNWTQITNTNFNPATKTLTANWTIPANGEYVLFANMIQSDGWVCSGNPGYKCNGCHTGTMSNWRVNDNGGNYPCQGCHLTIAVDSSVYSNQPKINMAEYWNLKPGNSYLFEGINQYAPSDNRRFLTKIAYEEKSRLCGHEVIAFRFTKNSLYGYWQPKDYHQKPGNLNLRFLVSAFAQNERWKNNQIGALHHITYRLDNFSQPDSLGRLGKFIYNSDGSWGMIRHYTADPLYNFENFYYAPYFGASNNIYSGWELNRFDRIYYGERFSSTTSSCSQEYLPNIAQSHLITKQRWTVEPRVETPAYTGPAIRIRQLEIGLTGWAHREDWWFAKNIGLVRIDKITFTEYLPDGTMTNRCSPNKPNYDFRCTNPDVMTNPPIIMKLKNYYVGDPLIVRVTSPSGNPPAVPINSRYRLSVISSRTNQPYTGKLEFIDCISDTSCVQTSPPQVWGSGFNEFNWIQNGVIEVNLNTGYPYRLGLHHIKFRPVVDKVPASPDNPYGETVVTKTELPWSNEVLLRLIPAQ